jgi:hypothetical protein
VQELAGSSVEADGRVLAVGADESDRRAVFRALFRPVAPLLEKFPLNADTPLVKGASTSPCAIGQDRANW